MRVRIIALALDRSEGVTSELLNGEILYTLREAQVVIEAWREEYNRRQPHSSLGYRPPAPKAIQVAVGLR